MLRTLMFLILLASCSSKKVYLEPKATFQGRVVIRRKMWLSEVKVPYKLPQKSLTTIRCEYKWAFSDLN